MKLISMTDYVLERNPQKEVSSRNLAFIKCEKYANFLKQPLKLGMFVPCDENDVPFVKPDITDFDNGVGVEYENFERYNKRYQQAKDRVLFYGIEYIKSKETDRYDILRISKELSGINYPKLWRNETIEDLVKHNLTLTESAIKKFNI